MNTDKTLRAAVVGVGYLGRFHAQKYKAVTGAELVGVYDMSPERAELIAKELGVAVFKQPQDLVGHVDCVTVAATTSAHYELCNFFLQNKIHVHVEKPITATSREAREICELADKNGLKLQVGHIERFNPALMAAREKLVKPLFIECHRLAPFKPRGTDVSVVLDLMIHDLDVILYLVKSEPVEVHAVGANVLTKTSDIANARIVFKSGTVANVTASRVSLTAQRKFRVFQENQYMSLDFGAGEVRLLTKTGEFVENAEPPIETETWNLEKSDALLAETQSFVNAIRDNTPCAVSGWDGLKALDLAETIIGVINDKKA